MKNDGYSGHPTETGQGYPLCRGSEKKIIGGTVVSTTGRRRLCRQHQPHVACRFCFNRRSGRALFFTPENRSVECL